MEDFFRDFEPYMARSPISYYRAFWLKRLMVTPATGNPPGRPPKAKVNLSMAWILRPREDPSRPGDAELPFADNNGLSPTVDVKILGIG